MGDEQFHLPKTPTTRGNSIDLKWKFQKEHYEDKLSGLMAENERLNKIII